MEDRSFMITNEQREKCKQALLYRQHELINQVQGEESVLSEKDAVGELSSYDNHPADMGTEQFERNKDFALKNHAEKELENINEALHALDEGTYGICSVCGEDIPFERLAAVPETDRCVEHAEDDLAQRSRPIEEESLSPNLNPGGYSDDGEIGYDAEDAWQDVSFVGTSETPSDFYGDRDNYNEMYPNSDENIGVVEEVEGIMSTKIDHHYEMEAIDEITADDINKKEGS